MKYIQRNLFNEPVLKQKESSIKKRVHTIQVSAENFLELQRLRDEQAQEVGCRGSYNMAITYLLALQTKYDLLLEKFKNIEDVHQQSLQQENQFLREVVLHSVQTPKTLSNQDLQYPSPNQQPRSLTPPHPPGAPPIRCSPPKPIHNYSPPNTGNIKKDYQKEIAQVFTGNILKPSDIIQTTKPKHINTNIHEIEEDFCVPPIDVISTAKRFHSEDAVAMNA